MRTAIFPARGGSQRIPRKNIRDFMGKPMLQWPIEAAKASGLFDHLVVSTDDAEIAELAHRLDCEVHMRPLDDGEVGTQILAGRVLDWMHASGEACVIYPCSPMLTGDDILGAYLGWRTREHAYAKTVLTDKSDAGCLYWGAAGSFIAGIPLEGNAALCIVPDDRFIDINHPEDWARAEFMFNALHP